MSTPPADTPSAPRVTLSRDLAGFLIELAIALQSHGVYPAGHPFLARSAEGVLRRLDGLLRERPTLSFGVARKQLVIEGVATEAANPVLAGLAGRLHRHRVGAVTLSRGLGAHEAASLLAALAADAEVSGPLLGGGAEAPSWPHVRLHPLTFDNLALAGDEGAAPGGPRAPQLWIGLARAALAAGPGAASDRAGTDRAGSDDADDAPEPAAVAEAIERHPRAKAYDQVIVGYLLQLAEELRGEGRDAAEVRRRLSQLVERLSPATLRRLVEMGGDAGQRRRFLLDAAHGFAAEAVVRLVEAAAEASGQTVSHSLLRLLSKLAAHAGSASAPAAGAAADAALREQVQLLVAGWELPDPNPEGYTDVLERFSRAPAGVTGLLPGPHAPEPERVLQTALETDADGPAAWSAAARLAADERPQALVELLMDAPPESRLAPRLWDLAANRAHLARLLRAGPEAAAALDALVARTGERAVPALLDELAESEARVARRAAITRLAALGPAAAEEAARRLGDPRWYVVRNLLSLLHEMGAWPAGFTPAPHLRHADARVRREAFKLALAMPGERARALPLALVDADAQVQRLGLSECLADCPPAAVPLVCRRLEDPAGDAELRLLAIRVLGASREPAALRALVKRVDGGRTLLGRRRLAPASPETLAALAALARGWRRHPAAAPFLDAAERSADPEVARAAHPRKDPP